MDEPDLPYGLIRDPRVDFFIGGLDAHRNPLPLTPDKLRASTDRWRTTPDAPGGVRTLLKTSRDLFIHSYFSLDFLPVAGLLALQAVEAGLRLRLSSERRLVELIEKALELGVIDHNDADRLDAARRLRNGSSHPDGQEAWTFGMAASIIAASHEMVAHLFPTPE